MTVKMTSSCRTTVTAVTIHPTINAAILKLSHCLKWSHKVAPICWGFLGPPLPSSGLLASWAPTSFGHPALPHFATLPLGPCPDDGSSPCLGTGPNFEQATMVGHPWFTHLRFWVLCHRLKKKAVEPFPWAFPRWKEELPLYPPHLLLHWLESYPLVATRWAS